jgi:hypothetical protein
MLRNPTLAASPRGEEVDKLTEGSQDILLDGRSVRDEKGHLGAGGFNVLHALRRYCQPHSRTRSRAHGFHPGDLTEQLGQKKGIPGAPCGECPIADRER